MSSLNVLTDESFDFQFPTIIGYSSAHTYTKWQNKKRQYYSKNKIFINNGDTYNAKYIIEYFKNARNINEFNDIYYRSTEYNDIINKSDFNTTKKQILKNKTQDEEVATTGENSNIMSVIGLFTKKQYKEFLDQPSKMKTDYLKKMCDRFAPFFTPHSVPLERPTTKHGQMFNNDVDFIITTSLLNEKSDELTEHLKSCKIVGKNEIPWTLMQYGTTVFDVTANDHESELKRATMCFDYIYNELDKYSDKELLKIKENGIIRKFVLISTVMTWVEESGNHDNDNNDNDNYDNENDNNENYENYENYEENVDTDRDAVAVRVEKHSERLPERAYQRVFELEKRILKTNSSRLKDVFETRVIGVGLVYGREQNALRGVFADAWTDPEEMLVSTVDAPMPAIHVNELARVVHGVVAAGDRSRDYVLAATESYSFNEVVASVRDQFCRARLVTAAEHGTIATRYGLDDWTSDLTRADLRWIATDRWPEVFDAQRSARREFVQASGHEFRAVRVIIISGQPATFAAAEVARRLARHYHVRLVDVAGLAEDRLTLLENARRETQSKINDAYEKLGDRDGEVDDVSDKTPASRHYEYEYNDHETLAELYEIEGSRSLNSGSAYRFRDETHLVPLYEDITRLEHAMENLNVAYDEFVRDMSKNKGRLNDHYLLPLIRESLSSFSCRNRGYVLDISLLTVEQIEDIFNNENVDRPDLLVTLSLNTNVLNCRGHSAHSTTRCEKGRWNGHYSKHCGGTNSDNSDDQSRGYYDEHDVESNNVTSESTIHDYRSIFESKIENINQKSEDEYEVTIINSVINYFSSRSINTLTLDVPLELNKRSNHLYYEAFVDVIIKRLGGGISNKADTYQECLPSKTKHTSEKFEVALNKLSIRKGQWNSAVDKYVERERKIEQIKSEKIQNSLRTNILPKLLKEVFLITNREVSVLHFPEKTLNKTKLCSTLMDEY